MSTIVPLTIAELTTRRILSQTAQIEMIIKYSEGRCFPCPGLISVSALWLSNNCHTQTSRHHCLLPDSLLWMVFVRALDIIPQTEASQWLMSDTWQPPLII